MGQIAPSKLISARAWRITFEALTEVEGPSGNPVWDWVPLYAVFAEHVNINAAERFSGDQVVAREYTRWVFAFDARMDPDVIDVPKTRRLTYGVRAYDIQTARRAGTQGALIEVTTLVTSSTAP
jgi:head-tail adaptor